MPTRELNRALYLWLAAVAATQEAETGADTASHEPLLRDLQRNRRATCAALARWPGLASRYRTLVDASFAVRPLPESLPPAEAARERLIRAVLDDPHAEPDIELPPLPARGKPYYPVALWLAEGERATRTTLASHSDAKHAVSAQQQDREADGKLDVVADEVADDCEHGHHSALMRGSSSGLRMSIRNTAIATPMIDSEARPSTRL